MNHPAIETVDLSRAFDDQPAVRSVTLSVMAGEIHAIVGLNGAGKTTLMRLLLGMVNPDSGNAYIQGCEAANLSAGVRSDLGYLIETPFAYPELTVRANLRAAAYLRALTGGRATSAVSGAIGMFQLDQWADRRAGVLSLGNRQRLGLASALLHDPSVLVLDEPGNGLDPAGVVFVRRLLRESADNGAGILVSSHHLDEIARIADRITVMHRGMVIGTLDPDLADLERRFFQIAYEADLHSKETRQ